MVGPSRVESMSSTLTTAWWIFCNLKLYWSQISFDLFVEINYKVVESLKPTAAYNHGGSHVPRRDEQDEDEWKKWLSIWKMRRCLIHSSWKRKWFDPSENESRPSDWSVQIVRWVCYFPFQNESAFEFKHWVPFQPQSAPKKQSKNWKIPIILEKHCNWFANSLSLSLLLSIR